MDIENLMEYFMNRADRLMLQAELFHRNAFEWFIQAVCVCVYAYALWQINMLTYYYHY